jgi:predicted glycosyltransferase
MRVLICVTHLLGTGHLSRALTLARAFVVKGHEAHVLSGGLPVASLNADGIILHQLLPVKSDGVNFTTLLMENNVVADESYLNRRKQGALALLAKVAPDVVITELFPFGRRVLKGEFLALLNGARNLARPPMVLGSVRDILAPPSKPVKALETDAILAAYYSAVLVHSDPAITALEVSWPVSESLRGKLRYTGFVAPPAAAAHPDGVGRGEVLVTAGGGEVGLPLFQTALQAAAADQDTKWRLLVGGNNKERDINALRYEAQSENVIIEPTRPDFRQMLAHAKAAVCMCGYNTAMDLLQCGTPAVFVPFDAGGEVEQTLRATALAERDDFAVVSAGEATAERILAALNRVTTSRPSRRETVLFDGAQETVKITEKLLSGFCR